MYKTSDASGEDDNVEVTDEYVCFETFGFSALLAF